ncbi:nephrin-like isoform X3 [Centruroides vittatus]|uniref:nephrin-like isoform X3 n=2 Tax=Centruroides TaxID=6875 RepID=UPI003510A271
MTMLCLERVRITLILASATVCFKSVFGDQQFFRTKPQNTNVIEDHTLILPCEVENQAGAVQWSKDGFVLGFDRSIPGYPRYQMIGNPQDGVHNLQIENAQLDDDGEYQCQVGPAANNKAIRADAHVTVLLPPKTITVTQHPNGSTVEVRESETLTFTCVVGGGKPAAEIKWYRKNVELRPDNVEVSVEDADDHRQNAISTMTLYPNPDDNGAVYTCEAVHQALSVPLRTSVELSVLFPPGPPEIEGYQEGETIRMGDTLTLSCTSRGGNPLAQLIWYKNEEQVDFSYTTNGRESTNTITILVDASDNNALYKCEAFNVVSPKPMTATAKLTVQFAPAKVTISGSKEAKAADNVTMMCITDPSNPPAEISWVVDGRPIQSNSTTIADPGGGWVTSSNITVTITGQERNMKMFSCYAVNHALGETVVETAVLSVLYPPDQPNIFGYAEGTPIRTDTLHRMTCVAHGGNPLPSVKWFREGKEIKSTSTTNGNVVTSELSIVVKSSDNGAVFRCEATNSAAPEPLVRKVKLTVHFPPSGVSIKIKPKQPKADQKVTLVCDSGSSNPQAAITWWKDGFLVLGTPDGVFDAPNGGKSVRNLLHLNVTSSDDGAVYTCQATNHLLQQSAHDAVTLNVLYKPEFPESFSLQTYDVIEGETTIINLTAQANPSSITYSWTTGGNVVPSVEDADNTKYRIFAVGPLLHINGAKRDDGGAYSCEATNEEGTNKITIQVNVHRGAKITRITEIVTVDQGDNAFLECVADANPITDDLITWSRSDFDMIRTQQRAEGGKSYLTVYNVSRDDSGKFTCTANNGVGTEDAKTAILVVKHKPVIDKSAPFLKAAGDKGENAQITCRANGAPNITFSWYRNGESVGDYLSNKFEMESYQVDYITWETVLNVNQIRTVDYGSYDCVARNELGTDRSTISLEGLSVPDPPIHIKALNVTHDSVRLKWLPGFDGGREQSFRVRYQVLDSYPLMFTDVFPSNATEFTVTNLQIGTTYVFQLIAINELGESSVSEKFVRVTTSSEVPKNETKPVITEVLSGKGDIPRIIIITVSVVGSFLLILNIILVICFVRKRRKKRLEEEDSDHCSSKAATIEMYAPSSYNETMNGETLSCTSEKSEPYSDGRSTGEYSEEQGKPVATTYLIDQGDGTYIPDGTIGQYNTYRYLDQVSRYSTLEKNSKKPNKNIYEAEEDTYADALRRNAYNQKVGYKVGSPSIVPGHASVVNIDMCENARYIPYPVGPVAPHVVANATPLLTTFNPNYQGSPVPPHQSHQMVPPPDGVVVRDEMDGHLV